MCSSEFVVVPAIVSLSWVVNSYSFNVVSLHHCVWLLIHATMYVCVCVEGAGAHALVFRLIPVCRLSECRTGSNRFAYTTCLVWELWTIVGLVTAVGGEVLGHTDN